MVWVGVRAFPSTASRSQGFVPVTGKGPAGAPELLCGWWQDWSWGCAAEFAGARRLLADDGCLAGDSVCSAHRSVEKAPVESAVPWGCLGSGTSSPGRSWLSPGQRGVSLPCAVLGVFAGGRGELLCSAGPWAGARTRVCRCQDLPVLGSHDVPWLAAGWPLGPSKPLISPRCFCA